MAKAQKLTHESSLQVGEACLCLHVQRASRALARRYDEALRPCELNNWQFSLLMHLARNEAPTVSGLAEELAMDRTTLTANLKPLERRGLLASRPDRDDLRARRLALTARGRALLERALPLWAQAQKATEEALAGNDLRALRGTLRALSD